MQILSRAFLLSLVLTLVLTGSAAAQDVNKSGSTGDGVDAKPAKVQRPAVRPVTGQDIEAGAELVSEFDINGMKVLVKRREGSQTVAAGLFVRGGARNLTPQNAGIEDLTLDLATEGSRTFPRERLRVEQAKMGTQIGASVGYDFSVVSLGTTRQNFARSWQLFTDVILNPAFAPDDFERVKNRKLIALSDDTDTPDSYLELLQERAAFAGHPYLNRPQGTPETVGKLTLNDIKQYHAQLMQTSRLLLVIVGDVDAAQIKQLATAAFGKLPRGDYKSEPLPQLDFKEPSVEVTTRALPTNYVQGFFVAPPTASPDIYAMRVARAILNDRVFEEVRVRRNLSYAPSAFLNEQGTSLGGIYVTAVDANQAVGVMLNEIEQLQNEPISDYELTATVAQSLTNYYLDQETNAAQARELARYELTGGGWRNSFTVLAGLRNVTPRDVQRVARQYMRNLRFVVLGDPKRIDRAIFTRRVGA